MDNAPHNEDSLHELNQLSETDGLLTGDHFPEIEDWDDSVPETDQINQITLPDPAQAPHAIIPPIPPQTAPPAPSPQPPALSRGFVGRELIETLLLALIIYWLVDAVVGRVLIDGTSMLPTITAGERLFVNNLAYFFDEPERGDIVVLHSPRYDRNLIKRLIGLPGDHVVIEEGKVRVNDVLLNEPYINADPSYTGDWTLSSEEVFVLGDNRNVSYDSHNYGPVSIDNIFGKAWAIYWPYSDIDIVRHHPHTLDG